MAVQNILINTVVPFLFEYGKQHLDESKCERALQWLEKMKPEVNNITNKWSTLGIKAGNALQSQSLLQLKNEYCSKQLCLTCNIGHYVLKNR